MHSKLIAQFVLGLSFLSLANCADQYTSQFDPCLQGCITQILANNCNGNGDDWNCFCKNPQGVDPSAAANLSDCVTAAENCPSSVFTNIGNKVASVCTSVDSSSAAPGALLGEGVAWKMAVGAAGIVPLLL